MKCDAVMFNELIFKDMNKVFDLKTSHKDNVKIKTKDIRLRKGVKT
jgi:hypothetical protein